METRHFGYPKIRVWIRITPNYPIGKNEDFTGRVWASTVRHEDRRGRCVGSAAGAGALTEWRGDRRCWRRGGGGSVHGAAAPTSPAGAEPGCRGPRRRRGDRRRQLHWRRRRATVSTSLVAGGSASGGGASGGEGVRQSGGGAQMLLCSRPAWSAEARVRTLQWAGWAGWQGKGLGGLG